MIDFLRNATSFAAEEGIGMVWYSPRLTIQKVRVNDNKLILRYSTIKNGSEMVYVPASQ